jgi:hypothetical protein
MTHPTVTTLFIAMMVGIVVYFAVVHFLFERLANAHGLIWEELGCPRLFKRLAFGDTLKFLRFLWRREYLPLNDSILTSLSIAASALLVSILPLSIYLQTLV